MEDDDELEADRRVKLEDNDPPVLMDSTWDQYSTSAALIGPSSGPAWVGMHLSEFTDEMCIICLARLSEPSALKATEVQASEMAWIPCGHVLHDTCLQEWCQVSNTCPTCRAAFESVHVLDSSTGNLLREYPVAPRTQPIDSGDDGFLHSDSGARCIVCGLTGEQDNMALCLECADPYHLHCLSLSARERDTFVCPTCVRVYGAQARSTRPQRAAALNARRQWDLAWERLRERTWHALNHEIADEEHEPTERSARGLRRQQQREATERRAWAARLRSVTHTAPDASSGPDISIDVSGTHAPRVMTGDPVTWDMFERARRLAAEPTSSNKRRRASDSAPATEGERPERKLKRPRRSGVELWPRDTALRNSNSARGAEAPALGEGDSSATGSSVLGDLLQEIQQPNSTSTVSQHHTESCGANASRSMPSLSPPQSPPTLKHSEPQSSPASCNSTPAFSQLSPSWQPRPTVASTKTTSSPPVMLTRRIKAEVEMTVHAALKPFFRDGRITKDEFTHVNKTVSRQFYARVAKEGKPVSDRELRDASPVAGLASDIGKVVKANVEALKKNGQNG